MPFFKKKQAEDYGELPPLPEGEELPPLPPLPEEEELPPMPETPAEPRKMKPGRPIVPEMSMATPPAMPSWKPIEAPTAAEKATVFVKLDKYREIMRTVSDIDDKLTELKATLDRIAAIKSREGDIIDGWAAMLSDAKAKIDDVNNKLTKPEA